MCFHSKRFNPSSGVLVAWRGISVPTILFQTFTALCTCTVVISSGLPACDKNWRGPSYPCRLRWADIGPDLDLALPDIRSEACIIFPWNLNGFILYYFLGNNRSCTYDLQHTLYLIIVNVIIWIPGSHNNVWQCLHSWTIPQHI